MPNPIWIANTRLECLVEANPILIRVTIKAKAAVDCINEFIIRDKCQFFLDINKPIFCACYIDFKSTIHNNFFLHINVYGTGIHKCSSNLKKKKRWCMKSLKLGLTGKYTSKQPTKNPPRHKQYCFFLNCRMISCHMSLNLNHNMPHTNKCL